MTRYLSSKLTVLYTLLIIMVVYIHNYYLEGREYALTSFLQNFISNGICRVANCLFFSISGYLFARNVETMKAIIKKAFKRIRTLLLPYIIWNIIFVLWYVVLELLPGLSQFNNSHGIISIYLNSSFLQNLYRLFWTPAAFQLWFVRDLLIMFAFSPIIYWITKKSWITAVIISILSVYFYGWLIYFWLGVILGMKHVPIDNYPYSLLYIAFTGFAFICYSIAIGFEIVFNNYLVATFNLLGLYFLWALYDLLAKGECMSKKGIWKYICGYSFFIYCFHEPTLNIIKKIALAVFGVNEASLIIFYFLNPWVMVTVAVLVAKLLQSISPKVYCILTGGR